MNAGQLTSWNAIFLTRDHLAAKQHEKAHALDPRTPAQQPTSSESCLKYLRHNPISQPSFCLYFVLSIFFTGTLAAFIPPVWLFSLLQDPAFVFFLAHD